MPRFLVSGKAELAADVAAALRAEGAETVEVGDLADLTRVCAGAGPGAFDGYDKTPALQQVPPPATAGRWVDVSRRPGASV